MKLNEIYPLFDEKLPEQRTEWLRQRRKRVTECLAAQHKPKAKTSSAKKPRAKKPKASQQNDEAALLKALGL